MMKFLNRQDAGIQLAICLQDYANRNDVLVLALPRGGVPVAYEIAFSLQVPLDVFIVRKLGTPGQAELAFGAIASGGAIEFNHEIIANLQIMEEEIAAVIGKETKELIRREKAYRDDKPFPEIHDKTVILVDDGIATGATLRAAIKALKQLQVKQLIIAVPVADKFILQNLQSLVDQIVCLNPVDELIAVGNWYEDFSQTEDEEVFRLLKLNT